MTLPKIAHPTFQIEVPSTGTKQNFRPYLVKEEKILLMAKAGESETEMTIAIKQVIESACLDTNFNVDSLTFFDIEYIFIQLRSRSVNSVVEVTYLDDDDDKPYKFTIALNDITVKFPEETNSNIKINDSLGIIMKYPTAALYSDKEFLTSGKDALFTLIVKCIDKIYDEDTIYEIKNYSIKELNDFVEELDPNTFDQIRKFINNSPTLDYEIKYTNSNGIERIIKLTTLSDFFSL